MATASEAGVYEFRTKVSNEDGSIEVEYDVYFVHDHADLIDNIERLVHYHQENDDKKIVEVKYKYLYSRE